MGEDKGTWTLLHKEALQWTRILPWCHVLKLQSQTRSFALHTTLIDGLDWSGVCIIVMFLSAVWTLILTAPIHRRASIAEQVM